MCLSKSRSHSHPPAHRVCIANGGGCFAPTGLALFAAHVHSHCIRALRYEAIQKKCCIVTYAAPPSRYIPLAARGVHKHIQHTNRRGRACVCACAKCISISVGVICKVSSTLPATHHIIQKGVYSSHILLVLVTCTANGERRGKVEQQQQQKMGFSRFYK